MGRIETHGLSLIEWFFVQEGRMDKRARGTRTLERESPAGHDQLPVGRDHLPVGHDQLPGGHRPLPSVSDHLPDEHGQLSTAAATRSFHPQMQWPSHDTNLDRADRLPGLGVLYDRGILRPQAGTGRGPTGRADPNRQKGA